MDIEPGVKWTPCVFNRSRFCSIKLRQPGACPAHTTYHTTIPHTMFSLIVCGAAAALALIVKRYLDLHCCCLQSTLCHTHIFAELLVASSVSGCFSQCVLTSTSRRISDHSAVRVFVRQVVFRYHVTWHAQSAIRTAPWG